jgi:hypothetical protein
VHLNVKDIELGLMNPKESCGKLNSIDELGPTEPEELGTVLIILLAPLPNDFKSSPSNWLGTLKLGRSA